MGFNKDILGGINQNHSLQMMTAVVVGIVLGIVVMHVVALPLPWMAFTVAIILFPLVIINCDPRKLFLAAILIDLPLQIDTQLFYRNEMAGLASPGGLHISVTTFALVVLYGLWLFDRKQREQLQLSFLLRVSLPLVAFLGSGLLSIAAATDVQLSAFRMFLLFQMFLMYVYIVGTVRTRQDLRFVLTVLFIGIVLESLIMIGMRITGVSIDFKFIVTNMSGLRPGGTMGHPNTAGEYLSFLLIPALAVLITHLNRSYQALAMLAFGLGSIALVLTLSRGSWLALAMALGLFCWFVWSRGWLPLAIPVMMIIGAGIVVIFFQDAIMDRLGGDDNGSAYSRIPLMRIAYRMIIDHPIIGVGINNYAVTMARYANLDYQGFWLNPVHNKYLLIWTEVGTGGLLAYLWLLGATIRRGWQVWKFGDRLLSPIALALACGIIGLMLTMGSHMMDSRPAVQMLWLGAAFIAALYNIGISVHSHESRWATQVA